MALGRIPGPDADVEFIRIDFTPSTAQPSSHRFAIATPALRASSSGPARLVGALLEMCWHFTPVAAIFAASWSSHLRPEGVIGSKVRPANMLSSVTSPNSPENRSMWVTPGNVSLVNCGKSSMVISPYFAFICSVDQPPFDGERCTTGAARSHRPVPRPARCRLRAGGRVPAGAGPAAVPPPRAAAAPAAAAAAGERALLENRTNRPGARRDSRRGDPCRS